MSDIVIRVENLSKRYRIGQREPYKALRDVLTDAITAPFRGRREQNPPISQPAIRNSKSEHFWALLEVSFEIKQGEVVGIIGRNGAGKSTLLKILSRTTEPTEGYAEIYGRVGSLLEVGTGFHPELTGRENIYLNAAILGMKRREIDRKFDEIVAFAEIDKFLDTPVKHYSSGMFVRLAFAVAAHLDPEILLVDEVLSVGDAAFQKKCLGKMGDVAKGGRTVLFVSHQMNSIRKLCERCIWLDAGHLRVTDSAAKVVSAYELASTSKSFSDTDSPESAYTPARFLRWEILEPKGSEPNLLTTLGPVTFKIVVQINELVRNGVHGIALWNSDNQLMWAWAAYNLEMKPGIQGFIYTLPGLPLRPGNYSWHISLSSEGRLLDDWHCLPELIVATEPLTHPRDEWSGILNIPCDFQLSDMQRR
ncbi:MAG TPA: polysaccharide ABC transporter ATP-binding protein [Thermodesulfobacteriota bacterium]|nr:polysaccharide ABC transporter ATP-binding protein [Thermodesulfobacteriota bacterium]